MLRKWFEAKPEKVIIMNMTVKEVQKECRKLAREVGATFKVHTRIRINNKPAYYIENRKTGEVIVENMSLGMAYENLLSGFVESKI